MKRREFLRVMGLGLAAIAMAGNGNDRGNPNEKPMPGNPNERSVSIPKIPPGWTESREQSAQASVNCTVRVKQR